MRQNWTYPSSDNIGLTPGRMADKISFFHIRLKYLIFAGLNKGVGLLYYIRMYQYIKVCFFSYYFLIFRSAKSWQVIYFVSISTIKHLMVKTGVNLVSWKCFSPRSWCAHIYCKCGKIHWAKHLLFSWFLKVLQNFSCEYLHVAS